MLRALDGLPINQEGDGVLCFRDTVVWFTGCDASSRTGHHTGRDSLVLEEPTADVDVMG